METRKLWVKQIRYKTPEKRPSHFLEVRYGYWDEKDVKTVLERDYTNYSYYYERAEWHYRLKKWIVKDGNWKWVLGTILAIATLITAWVKT